MTIMSEAVPATNLFEAHTASEAPVAMRVSGLVKRFKQYANPTARLLEWLSLGLIRRHKDFTALDDISFSVRKGECFGVIGPNGSGKSTLLKILTGVLSITSGSVEITGRVTSLLELGTGFNPDLTGRENLINSGRLLGFDPAQTRAKLVDIIEFAELQDSVDVPIKYYSTGMTVRLAFSLFAHADPDVFIVDEALSVGDVAFSRKCFQRLDQMREGGCTLIFVSHDLAAVRKYCEQVMFLHHGKCEFLGNAFDTTDLYLEVMSPGAQARGLALSKTAAAPVRPLWALPLLPAALMGIFEPEDFAAIDALTSARIGTNAVRILAVKTTDANDQPRGSFTVGERVRLHILARAEEDIAQATVSVQLVNRMGIGVWGTNHALLTGQTIQLCAGEFQHAVFEVPLDISHDHYSIDVGWGDAGGEGHVFDRITGAASLLLNQAVHSDFIGLVRLPCDASVTAFPPQPAAPGLKAFPISSISGARS